MRCEEWRDAVRDGVHSGAGLLDPAHGRRSAGSMAHLPIILHYLEFDYYHYDPWKPRKCESLTLLAVGHRNVVSLCYFITQGGNHSGWHGSWSADEHDDTGLPTRLTLFFSWRGTEAIQYRQVMQHSQHKTWTNISGQPTCISLKSWSMTSMLFV